MEIANDLSSSDQVSVPLHLVFGSRKRDRSSVIATNLIRLDSILQRLLHTISRDLSSHQVRKPTLERSKEIENGNLQRIRSVGVDLEVGFDDEKASFFGSVLG